MVSELVSSIIIVIGVIIGIIIGFIIVRRRDKKIRAEAPEIILDKKEVMKDDNKTQNREIQDSIEREFGEGGLEEFGEGEGSTTEGIGEIGDIESGETTTTKTDNSIRGTGETEINGDISLQPPTPDEGEQRDSKKRIKLHRPDDL